MKKHKLGVISALSDFLMGHSKQVKKPKCQSVLSQQDCVGKQCAGMVNRKNRVLARSARSPPVAIRTPETER